MEWRYNFELLSSMHFLFCTSFRSSLVDYFVMFCTWLDLISYELATVKRLLTFQALALRQSESAPMKRICSDEGLTLETSASESLYGGQFTLSTQLSLHTPANHNTPSGAFLHNRCYLVVIVLYVLSFYVQMRQKHFVCQLHIFCVYILLF